MQKDCIQTRLTRTINIPDHIKIARFAKSPELGPKILFFSGGSALTQTSKCLTQYTHNSIHIITSFDSGGSSAILRSTFNMPAIGDLRSRIMALADRSLTGNPEVIELFSYRFPHNIENHNLKQMLLTMISGIHHLVQPLPQPMKNVICSYIEYFYKHMPKNFPLKGASIGNLILTSGYLQHNKKIDSVIYLFSQLVNAKGIVRPVTETCAQLCVQLNNNEYIVGQDKFTGKEYPPIEHAIQKVFLLTDEECKHRNKINNSNHKIKASHEVLELISQADLICYPMGSFFSSLIANLLPEGITEAIKANPCPKIFIPSKGTDPELFGYAIDKQVETLINYLNTSHNSSENPIARADTNNLLNFILFDTNEKKSILANKYFKAKHIRDKLLFYPLVPKSIFGKSLLPETMLSAKNKLYINEQALCNVLLSLC